MGRVGRIYCEKASLPVRPSSSLTISIFADSEISTSTPQRYRPHEYQDLCPLRLASQLETREHDPSILANLQIVEFSSLKQGVVSESRYTSPRIYTHIRGQALNASLQSLSGPCCKYRTRPYMEPWRPHLWFALDMGLDANVVSAPVPAHPHARPINLFSKLENI